MKRYTSVNSLLRRLFHDGFAVLRMLSVPDSRLRRPRLAAAFTTLRHRFAAQNAAFQAAPKRYRSRPEASSNSSRSGLEAVPKPSRSAVEPFPKTARTPPEHPLWLHYDPPSTRRASPSRFVHRQRPFHKKQQMFPMCGRLECRTPGPL